MRDQKNNLESKVETMGEEMAELEAKMKQEEVLVMNELSHISKIEDAIQQKHKDLEHYK